MPSDAPLAFMQEPPQHSLSRLQASPFCVQNEGAPLHTPFEHRPEQHSALPPHVLPDVLHAVLSGAQVPLLHTPPQHSPSLLHEPLSAVHCLSEHLKSTHEYEQQSGPEPQSSPAMTQAPATRVHVPVNVSQ